MNITDRVHTNTIRDTFTSLELPVPKALTGAFTRAEKLAGKANHLGAADGELLPAVTAAILADREPTTDPDVQRIVTGMALANPGLQTALESAAVEEIRSVCENDLESIVNTWAKAFNRAASELSNAHARIGSTPLDQTATILAKGGDIAAVWASATTAVRTIDTIIGGWSSLMTVARMNPLPQHRALRLAALNHQQWRDLSPKADAWEVVSAGLTLSLPTADQYRARVAAIASEHSRPATVVDELRSSIAGHEIRVPVATSFAIRMH